MELKPVGKIDPPTYPAAEELADAKALLSAHIPRRWRKAKGLAGAMAAVLAASCSGGCGADTGNGVQQKPVTWQRGLNSLRMVPPDPLVSEASDWVESICRDKSKSRAVFAGVILPVPVTTEDDTHGILQDPQK